MTTTAAAARRTHLCEPWQINQAYLQMYRQLRDAFALASDTEHLLLDLVPDLVEINDTLVEVRERALFTGEPVDQLENE
jgi:hypothetical protein